MLKFFCIKLVNEHMLSCTQRDSSTAPTLLLEEFRALVSTVDFRFQWECVLNTLCLYYELRE